MGNTWTIPQNAPSGVLRDAAKPGMTDVPPKPVETKTRAQFLAEAQTYKDLHAVRMGELGSIADELLNLDLAIVALQEAGALTPIVQDAMNVKRAAVLGSELERWENVAVAARLVCQSIRNAAKATK